MSKYSKPAQFEAFHTSNPRVYELFKKFTFEVINKGHTRFSADAILHRIRWETQIDTYNGETFKITNDYSAFYSRLFMSDYPNYSGLFQLKPSGADNWQIKKKLIMKVGYPLPPVYSPLVNWQLLSLSLEQLHKLPSLALHASNSRLLVNLPISFDNPNIALYLNQAYSLLQNTNHKIVLRIGPALINKFRYYLKHHSHAQMIKMHAILTNDMYNTLPAIAELAELIPIMPDLQLHWATTGKYITADNPKWQIIKQSWGRQRPIINCGICPWHLASWAIPLAANRLTEVDYEYMPLNYLTLPNRKVLLERLKLKDLTTRAAGIWHLGVLDNYLEYLNWADVLFSVNEPLKFMPFVHERLEELRQPMEV
jgi:hypothetical protein